MGMLLSCLLIFYGVCHEEVLSHKVTEPRRCAENEAKTLMRRNLQLEPQLPTSPPRQHLNAVPYILDPRSGHTVRSPWVGAGTDRRFQM